MKKIVQWQAGALALTLAISLAGCGAPASTAAESTAPTTAPAEETPAPVEETPAPSEAAENDTEKDAATDILGATPDPNDPYSYLSDFDYSEHFDENGYFKGLKASDYITLPEDFDHMPLTGDYEVTDDQTMKFIEQAILAQYPIVTQVTDRPVQDGDTVNVTTSELVWGDNKITYGEESTYDMKIDTTATDDVTANKVSNGLIGHQANEKVFVNVDVVVDTAGKTTEWPKPYLINYIAEYKNPELTDAWVQENVGEMLGVNSVEELKAFSKDLIRFFAMEKDAYDWLMANSTVSDTLPEALNDVYRDMTLYYYYGHAMTYGIDLATFVEMSGYESVDAYLEDSAEECNNEMKKVLLKQAVAEQLGIQCDDAALKKYFPKYLGTQMEDEIERVGANYVRSQTLYYMVMERLTDDAAVS